MDPNILKEAMAAYQAVYSQEDVEQLDEQGGRLPGTARRAAQQAARERQNVQRAQAPTLPTKPTRGGSSRYQAVAADKGRGGDAAYRAGGGDAAARSGLTRQQIQQKGMTATKAAAAKPAAEKPAPKPAPTPAAKPAAPAAAKPAAKPAATGGAKPAALGSAAKVEPAKPAEKPSAMDTWAKANPRLAQAQKIRQQGGSRAEVNKSLYNKGTAAAEKTSTVVKASFDMFSSSNVKGMIEAYADVYAPQELDEKTAMAKRGYDEAPIRKKIAKSTGGGKAADRATELEKKSTFGDTKKEKQRSDYARKQRGDFRKTTSSSPGLSGYAHKSDDPKVKEKQAARGAQRGALTPAEKKQLNREEFDIFDIVLEFLQAEGYAETLEEAEWMMANELDADDIDAILGEGKSSRPRYPGGRGVLDQERRDEKREASAENMRGHTAGPGTVTKNPKKLRKQKAMGEFAKEQFEAWLDEAMTNYEKNRKRAAQRAAARNAARDQGKTGAVPGVGYVTPRRERETWTDESGKTRHAKGL